MEKRWCKRIPVSISAEIHHNGGRVSECLVKDISLRGLGIVSGPLAFYKNTQLKIKFPGAKLVSGNIDVINAVVVRNSNHDIGLMFTPTEPELLYAIIRSAEKDDQKIMTPAGSGS